MDTAKCLDLCTLTSPSVKEELGKFLYFWCVLWVRIFGINNNSDFLVYYWVVSFVIFPHLGEHKEYFDICEVFCGYVWLDSGEPIYGFKNLNGSNLLDHF